MTKRFIFTLFMSFFTTVAPILMAEEYLECRCIRTVFEKKHALMINFGNGEHCFVPVSSTDSLSAIRQRAYETHHIHLGDIIINGKAINELDCFLAAINERMYFTISRVICVERKSQEKVPRFTSYPDTGLLSIFSTSPSTTRGLAYSAPETRSTILQDSSRKSHDAQYDHTQEKSKESTFIKSSTKPIDIPEPIRRKSKYYNREDFNLTPSSSGFSEPSPYSSRFSALTHFFKKK